MQLGSESFGHAFEHFMFQELFAYRGYFRQDKELSYWRTATGYEVDCIFGNGQVAIEIKSVQEVQSRHTKGLKAFLEEYPQCRPIIVSFDPNKRILNGIEVFPVKEFLSDLWKGLVLC